MKTFRCPFSVVRFPLFLPLALMAASLTLSPFMMSVSQILLLLVWLFTGDPLGVKLKRFLHNKVAIVLVSIYLLHIIGLVYTTDFQYAFKDLKVKLPLIVFPLVLSSEKALDKKHFDWVMLIYVLAVWVATSISFGTYLRHDYQDVREISPFISHIRFCLNIVLVIGVILYYFFTRPAPWWEQMIQGMLLAWFCYQLFVFESLSGYAAFAGMMAASLLYLLFTKVKGVGWRVAGLVVVLGLPIVAGFALRHWVAPMLRRPAIEWEQLDRQTAMGNDYWHDTVCFPVENGRYVGLYFCRPEMREAWNRRSALDYDGLTLNGENLEATLARYLTSKDLRKDAEGVAALTEEDIRNVEQGVANYDNWSHPGFYSRLSETVFEYNLYHTANNPNGGSLSQRIEYTKASFHLIGQHPLFGVGTGDIPDAYQRAYDEMQSPLEPQFRHKAHNQYLSITVGFGVVGLLLFLTVLLFPYLCSRKNRNYLYTVFLTILLISMFPEDTIESQAGVSFYAYFNSLLIFANEKEDSSPEKPVP